MFRELITFAGQMEEKSRNSLKILVKILLMVQIKALKSFQKIKN